MNNDLVDEQETIDPKDSTMIINPLDADITSSVVSSSPLLISISPSSSSSLLLTTNENDTFEPLVEEERKEEEEEQRCNDGYNLDEEKKNNSSLVYDYHASGILLINDEPTQIGLLGQERKEKEKEEERERASSPLPTLEQSNQQQTEDESSLQTLSNDFNPLTMITNPENINDDHNVDDERFKKIEVEEIPDDEETLVNENNQSIEPTDYIHTDDEPRKKSTSTLPTKLDDPPIKFDNVLSCYEKAFAKIVDTSPEESVINTQQSTEDPIALRALKRFEQRMSAAAAAATKEETNSSAIKAKSSWSGSSSLSRKSLENLLKATEQQELRPAPAVPPTPQFNADLPIRKTSDDHSSNYELTLDSHPTNDPSTSIEEQLQPRAIVENDDQRGE